eukprot:XP_001689698.1 predicted protein [Chlamydomonas reinhardtii]
MYAAMMPMRNPVQTLAGSPPLLTPCFALPLPTANTPNQLWLDYWNFAQLSLPGEGYVFGMHTGAGQWQVVKVQMTALGNVPNTALVSDCTFDGTCGRGWHEWCG